MPKIFAISDTWFNRPLNDRADIGVAGNNDNIISGWNSVVGDDDTVYVLGGFGISDMYHILVRLKGNIHFLSNYFNEDEAESMDIMRNALERSSDQKQKERIHFDKGQIVVLNDSDAILSYYPLADWSGKDTGTYCFHGLNDNMDMNGHSISCSAYMWNFIPVDIGKIQEDISAFNSNI